MNVILVECDDQFCEVELHHYVGGQRYHIDPEEETSADSDA